MSADIHQLALQIDALLPQTQCRQCQYEGCKPYAQAIAAGEADINQCPPGGDAGIRALAALTGQPYKPLNPAHGSEKPKAVAVIDESTCIGCTLCIQACPVDAIVGAAKLMHTVIAAECTGCELCIAPCPVDCISMHTVAELAEPARQQARDKARARYEFRQFRLARDKQERAARLAAKAVQAREAAAEAARRAASDPAAAQAQRDKQAIIKAAMERAAARRAAADTATPQPADPKSS